MDVLGRDKLALAGGRDDERTGRECVDATGDPTGRFGDGIDGAVLEDQLTFGDAGAADTGGDVLVDLLGREREQTRDGDDAAVERVMSGLGQALVEGGLAGEQQDERALAIEVGNREQADVLEAL